jgi:hypothetical protein
MKKLLMIAVIIMIFFTSCKVSKNPGSNLNNENPPIVNPEAEIEETIAQAKRNYTRAVSLIYDKALDTPIDGFNTTFIEVEGIRIVKKPYRTDNLVLNHVDEIIGEMENSKRNYYISIKSGPGISRNGEIDSIFDRSGEALYFAQMVREVALRYNENKYFKGISLDIGSETVSVEKYYETITYIVNKVQSEVPAFKFVVSLHPLAFEEEFFNPSELGLKNVIFNLNLNFKALSYPGYAQGFKSSYELDKNVILKKLQPYVDLTTKSDSSFIISIKAPWVKNTEVMLQDMFEITKMLKFDYRIHFGNSEDVYDIRTNEEVLRVIKRHSN